jgi:hypoxanthine phosphoribosyltransferase
MNKIFYTWEEIENAVNYITNQIKEEGYQIDVIYGIPRGGLIVAVLLSHKLDKPLILDPLTAKDKRILITDDISDTGETFLKLFDKLDPREMAYRPITATIHFKPGSRFVPDIYVEETTDWIVYKWETEATSKADYENVH